jgi:hypothetical protein
MLEWMDGMLEVGQRESNEVNAVYVVDMNLGTLAA